MSPRADDVPLPLRLAAERLGTARGQALQLRRAFDGSQIPMLIVDNERRYIEANAAARLSFRMPLHELRRNRIDDLTAREDWPLMEEAWAELLERRSVSGLYLVTFKDGSTLWVLFAAVANVLPAQHLIAFLPADWPGDELDTRQHGDGHQPAPLSPRQLGVLGLVASGASAGEIASELSISEATVRTHVKHILERLSARNRAHAVAIAMTHGLIGDGRSELG